MNEMLKMVGFVCICKGCYNLGRKVERRKLKREEYKKKDYRNYATHPCDLDSEYEY